MGSAVLVALRFNQLHHGWRMLKTLQIGRKKKVLLFVLLNGMLR